MWRILLVENNSEVRARVLAVCKPHEGLRIIATTEDGEQATRLSQLLKPDAIVCNVSLCAHDRFAILENIMSHSPTRIVVYGSGSKAYDLGLDRAQQYGAMQVYTHALSDDVSAERLLELVQSVCTQKIPLARPAATTPLGAPKALTGAQTKAVEPAARVLTLPLRLIAIGASTGGPAAIEFLLRKWSKDFPLPVVVAQHMTAGFSTDLVRWLDTLGTLRVKLGEDEEALQAGTMYFAPDGTHIALASDDRLRITAAKDDEAEVPSVNKLFDSVARFHGGSAVGALLTGMGEDGAQGLLRMNQSGSRTLVQDRDTSLVFGMPAAAHRLGAAQLVLSLGDIADYLNDCARAVRRPKK